VAVGFLTGSRLLGVAAAVIAVLLLPRPRAAGNTDEGAKPAEAGGFFDPFAWTILAPGGLTLADAAGRLRSIGLRLDHDGGARAELSGGSQLQTRLLGGDFVDPARLPIAITLEAAASGGSLTAKVEDALKFGVRDHRLESRYALRVAEIRDALQEPAT
jgi:hypothetical protein